jgi:hypothetical protein
MTLDIVIAVGAVVGVVVGTQCVIPSCLPGYNIISSTISSPPSPPLLSISSPDNLTPQPNSLPAQRITAYHNAFYP